jgi:hypothetical protein
MFSIVLHLPLFYQTSTMDSLLEMDCSVHIAELVRLRGDLAIKGEPAIKADPVAQSEAVAKALGDPELRSGIVGFLNNGDAKDLVTTLQVSKPFFHSTATTLCRRIEVPVYEYKTVARISGRHALRIVSQRAANALRPRTRRHCPPISALWIRKGLLE